MLFVGLSLIPLLGFTAHSTYHLRTALREAARVLAGAAKRREQETAAGK